MLSFLIRAAAKAHCLMLGSQEPQEALEPDQFPGKSGTDTSAL